MSNENKSIHNFDINLICKYFSYLERQSPGSPEEIDVFWKDAYPGMDTIPNKIAKLQIS